MIQINQSRCIECMTCVLACAFDALQDVDGSPVLADPGMCIRCMHCGAVCPTEAITYDDEPSILESEIKKLPEEFAADLRYHILMRRSYRNFGEEPVSRGVIEAALELAAWAPSAKNQHPAKWIVIDNKETIELIVGHILRYVEETGISPEIKKLYENGRNVVTGNAPTLILAYARDRAISPETDTAIAMTTAELYLQAKGVGTCWAGYLKRMSNSIPEIRNDILEIPEGCSVYGAFMAGYPDENEKYIHIPERRKRANIKWA
ncbi:MAG: nitroreductase family protein [Bacillota bacterium]|nr:nitroreductase family protein [Bacillota bacterium]